MRGRARQRRTPRRANSDADLILAFIRGEVSLADIEKEKGRFYKASMFSPYSEKLAILTHRLWAEHGPDLSDLPPRPDIGTAKKVREKYDAYTAGLPVNTRIMAHWYGKPGDPF
jgi:hypothetical protein